MAEQWAELGSVGQGHWEEAGTGWGCMAVVVLQVADSAQSHGGCQQARTGM